MALLDEIVREWTRVKIQQQDIINYNGANLAYTHGVDIANKLKLSEAQKVGVSPFPASTLTNVTAVSEGGAGLGPSLLSRFAPVVLGAALGGGGLLLGQLMAPRAPPQQAPPPPAAPPIATAVDPNVGLSVEGFLKR